MTQLTGNMPCMTDHTEATSTTRQFAPLAIILGIPLIFAAFFFYTSPVVLETGGAQGIFKCGSPSSPNVESKNTCAVSESIARNKAIYSGLSGVALVGLGAVWLLRGQRHDDDWEDDGPRRRGGDDVDLRGDDRLPAGGPQGRLADPDDEPLRGVGRDRSRSASDDLDDVDDSRAARRRGEGRRSVLRDDDFGESAPRRRADDDWSTDGWR